MDSQNKLDLEGRLDRHPLAELLIEISHGGLSGSLRLEKNERKIVIYFEDGNLVFAASNAREHKLFEILLREEKITPPQLSEIKDFVNDLKLKESLLACELFSEEEMRNAFTWQFELIFQEIIVWSDGDWFFTPLARIRDEMRQPFEFSNLFFEYGRSFSGAQAAERLRSFRETFRLRKKLPELDLQPQEAFLLSRFGDRHLTIENLRDLSGLSETETFRILYALWLGGFLKRENWSAAFSAEKLNEINSAKLKLKTPAVEMKTTEEKLPVASPTPEVIEEKEQPSKEETELTLEDYLEQIENAEHFYEVFDILPSASESEIKKAYFSYAKRFHPDLFYRQVEADKHKEIQNAFTEIAQAYETLRNKEIREVYDYRLRKNLEFRTPKQNAGDATTANIEDEILDQAGQIFEHGFALLMDENFSQALSYLARAVNMVDDNAKYHAYYGRALAENDKKHQAESELQNAIKLDSENPDYRLMLIRLFIEIGLTKRAEGEINRLLEIAPDNYEAKTLLDSLPEK